MKTPINWTEIKAVIKDDEALRQLTPWQVLTYLYGKDWTPKKADTFNAAWLWEHEAGNLQIAVNLNHAAEGYHADLMYVLMVLEIAEKRSQLAIYADLWKLEPDLNPCLVATDSFADVDWDWKTDTINVPFCWFWDTTTRTYTNGSQDFGLNYLQQQPGFRILQFGRKPIDVIETAGNRQVWVDRLNYLQQQPGFRILQFGRKPIDVIETAGNRQVWVDSMKQVTRQALETPIAFRTFLEARNPEAVIGWEPVEAFLKTLGIDRATATVGHVDIFYQDEELGIPVLGTDRHGALLTKNLSEMPDWVADFVYEMELLDDTAIGVLCIKHAIALLDQVTADGYYPTDKTNRGNRFKIVQWCVNKDLITETEISVCSVGYNHRLESLMTARFRCLDDDKEVYFEGFATPATQLEPLDDYCKPDSGCTEIQYLQEGEWQTL